MEQPNPLITLKQAVESNNIALIRETLELLKDQKQEIYDYFESLIPTKEASTLFKHIKGESNKFTLLNLFFKQYEADIKDKQTQMNRFWKRHITIFKQEICRGRVMSLKPTDPHAKKYKLIKEKYPFVFKELVKTLRDIHCLKHMYTYDPEFKSIVPESAPETSVSQEELLKKIDALALQLRSALQELQEIRELI